MSNHVYPRPEPHLVLAEGPRALSAMATLWPAAPWLASAPRGDGHGVLVMPGFRASDYSTALLRGFLVARGFQARPWNLGVNTGPALNDLASKLAGEADEVGSVARL